MADLTRIAQIEKNVSSRIVFSTTTYKGETYVDIREYVETATYNGFTKKGIRLHSAKLDEFIDALQKVRASLAAGPEPAQATKPS